MINAGVVRGAGQGWIGKHSTCIQLRDLRKTRTVCGALFVRTVYYVRVLSVGVRLEVLCNMYVRVFRCVLCRPYMCVCVEVCGMCVRCMCVYDYLSVTLPVLNNVSMI